MRKESEKREQMKQKRNAMKVYAKRILAAALSLVLVNSVIDYTGLTMVHAQGENEVKIITAFADLENDVKEQILSLGAEENDITLPGSLTVTIETKAEEETTTEETTTAVEKITGAEEPTTVSENTPADGTGEADFKTGKSTEEVTIDGITWQLDTENSAYSEFKGGIAPEDYFTSCDKNGEAIETANETWEGYYEANAEVSGAFYTYTAVLPETDADGNTLTLAEGVELPEIVVMVGESGIMLMTAAAPYNISSGKITINSSNKSTYNNSTITGTSTANNIVVDGVEVNLTISSLDIQIAVTNNAACYIPAIELKNNAKLNLTLADTNTLKGGGQSAGIKVPGGCTLNVAKESTGSMKVTGGSYSAGIGADGNIDGTEPHVKTLGTINIAGGTVEAYGTGPSAGIGGSAYGRTGTINITGGTVNATGGSGSYNYDYFTYESGAGIGGGSLGYVAEINISGGEVTAIGGYQNVSGGSTSAGTGIGCGSGAGLTASGSDAKFTCGTIRITGGNVSAKGGNNNAVNAIGYGVSPTFNTSKYLGSVTIGQNAILNLNGGEYCPKEEGNNVKKHTFTCTVYDGRLDNGSYAVSATIGGKTWKIGSMNVSGYGGTITFSEYFNNTSASNLILQINGYEYDFGSISLDGTEITHTLTVGTKLYPVKLKFKAININPYATQLQISDIQVKQNNSILNVDKGTPVTLGVPSDKLSYAGDYTGCLTIYVPENTGNTEIAVIIPGINDDNQIVQSGLSITTGENTILMYESDTSCQHEIFDQDGFCANCRDAYESAQLVNGYYEISNAGQLFWYEKEIKDRRIGVNSNVKLMQDIEIPSGRNWTYLGPGTSSQNGDYYKGTFDGNGHVISGLVMDETSQDKYFFNGLANGGKIKNLGLILNGGDWDNALVYTTQKGSSIENCFVISETNANLSYAFTKNNFGSIKNCFAYYKGGLYNYKGGFVYGSSSGTTINCFTTYGSSDDQENNRVMEKDIFKTGEIAYKLNGNQSDGVWGQDIGTDDYPHFLKTSKTVYYDDSASPQYYNNQNISITSAVALDVTATSAKISVSGTTGADVFYVLNDAGYDSASSVIAAAGNQKATMTSGSSVISLTGLTGGRNYTCYLVAKNSSGTSDMKIVMFRTQQEAPTAEDISIDYEKETLQSLNNTHLEYAMIQNAETWTVIPSYGLFLTDLLDNNNGTGNISLFVRKRAASGMEASVPYTVKIPARTASTTTPIITYTTEKLSVPTELAYMISKTVPTIWTTAVSGTGTAVELTDYISSAGTEEQDLFKIYYRTKGSNDSKKFAGKVASIRIPARPAKPDVVSCNSKTYNSIKLDAETNAEYGIISNMEEPDSITWKSNAEFTELKANTYYGFTSRIPATSSAFSSQQSEVQYITTWNQLIADGVASKLTAEDFYGKNLAEMTITPADNLIVHDANGLTVNGCWKFAATQNGKQASSIYPEINGNVTYQVVFEPDNSNYGNILSTEIIPSISVLPVSIETVATLADVNQSNKDSSWYIGNATLQAPTGYYISNNQTVSSFGKATSLTVTEADGDYTYYLRDSSAGESTSGGITEAKKIEIHIDATAPTFDNSNITYKQGANSIINRIWNWIIGKEVITVTVPITEAGSGLNREDISITLTKSQNNCKLENPTVGNIALSGSKETGYRLSFTIPEEYAGTYSVSAVDQAGNQGSLTAEVTLGGNGMVIIDTTAPTLTVNLVGTKFENSTDNIFDDIVTIQIGGNDQAGTSAGFKSLSYRLDQGGEQTIERTDFAAEKVSVFSDASLVFNTAGAHTLVVKVTDMAGNETTKSVSFKIFRITNADIIPASTITYDGMAIEEGTDFTLDKDGSTSTVTYSYQVNFTDEFTNGLPVDAGTYYVRAEIAKDMTNCKKAVTKVCQITIEKAEPIYSVTNQSIKLGKSLTDIQKATIATGVGNETVAGAVKWYASEADRNNNTELTNHTFTGNIGDKQTLYWSYVSTNRDYSNTTGTTEFTMIDKDIPQLTVGNIIKPYDGIAVTSADISGTAKVGSKGVTGTWSFAGGTPTMKDADTYPVTVQFIPDNDTDYAMATKAITVTISKKAAAIKAALTKTSITIGDSLPTASVTYSGVLSGESLTPTVTQPELIGMPANSNATGTYTITWSNMAALQSEINVLPAAKNYNITYGETATLTINAQQSSSNTDSDSDTDSASSNSGNTEAVKPAGPVVTPAAPTQAPKLAQTSKPSQKEEQAKAPEEPANKEVTLGQGENGKEDWGEVSEEITDILTNVSEDSTEPVTVTVNMNGATELPADIISLIAGKNIDLTLDMGEGISWTINGKSVTGENFSNIDLNVTKNADKIPVDIINQISGEHYTMQIELSHNGEFGFTATLNINLEKDNAGYYANLFYFHEDTEELELVGTAQIDKEGNAALDFVHASAYTIVISEEPMVGDVLTDAAADDKEVQAGIDTTDTNSEAADEATGSMMALWIILVIVIVIAVSGGIYFVKKKKETA